MSGYWKAPRALVRLLTSRRVTPNEYMLLHFLAESGADRAGGVDTSNAFLADALNVSVKTIGRALRGLRARGLIEFDDHRGAAIFIVRTTAALAALEREPETPEGTREAAGDRTRGDVAMSQSVSELTWDTRPFSLPPEPASVGGSQRDQPGTADVFADASTETETETKTENQVENRPPPPAEVCAWLRSIGVAIKEPAE